MTIVESLRGAITRSDHLVLESAPLHTERPEWAAHAPAQVEAACKRGAHFIGLTETRGERMAEVKWVVHKNGYQWFQSHMDAHRNVTLLVKRGLTVLDHGDVVVNNNHRVSVTVDFHGSRVTVFQMHWEQTDNKGGLVQTHSLIEAMKQASAGKRLAFYMGDSNPSRRQHMLGSQPNLLLQQAGMPVIFEELHQFPAHIGVNVIGRNLKDSRVKAVKVETHPALGSDHIPATATYSIRRLRRA